jgi:hypothetical protein
MTTPIEVRITDIADGLTLVSWEDGSIVPLSKEDITVLRNGTFALTGIEGRDIVNKKENEKFYGVLLTLITSLKRSHENTLGAIEDVRKQLASPYTATEELEYNRAVLFMLLVNDKSLLIRALIVEGILALYIDDTEDVLKRCQANRVAIGPLDTELITKKWAASFEEVSTSSNIVLTPVHYQMFQDSLTRAALNGFSDLPLVVPNIHCGNEVSLSLVYPGSIKIRDSVLIAV